jgi:hypothetical protein
MGDFLSAILAFPTVIFTAALALVLLYWLIVLVGLLDVDALDPSAALEGSLEGAVDGALDGAVDGALDGAAEGAAEAGVEGAAGDGVEAGDADVEVSGLARGLQALGLYQVPLTLSLSLLIFFSWVLCFLGMRFLRSALPARWLGSSLALVGLGSLVALLAVIVGMLFTTWAVRPLRPVFQSHDAPRRATFVGRLCTITTGRVDAGFGQAEIEDGGGGLRVDVRCFEKNPLKRGSRALVFDYDAKAGVYHVSPAHEGLKQDRS